MGKFKIIFYNQYHLVGENMNILGKIYCRTFQQVFRWIMPMFPYRQPETLESVMEIKNIMIVIKNYQQNMPK